MANEIQAQIQQGIAWNCTVASGAAVGERLKVTGNATFDRRGADEKTKGYLATPRDANTGMGVVMLRGRAVIKVKLAANLAAGVDVKGAADSSGVQQVAAFVEGTDAEPLREGWLLTGGNSGDTVLEVLY
jgi:hypothetical protein